MPDIAPDLRFPGAKGVLKPDVANRYLPRFRHKLSRATRYAIPFKRATYWLIVEPDGWTVTSTKMFRAEYEPANAISRAVLAKHLKHHRSKVYHPPYWTRPVQNRGI